MLAEAANAAKPVTGKPKGGRRFLFIGGPFGPFFRQLATRLQHEGAEVLHVHMHGADFLDWGFRDAVIYRGPHREWRAWLCALMDRHKFTDVATYGDCGVYSSDTLEEARERGMVRHVFELGYLRPDWITLDENGVNGNSSLPRDPESYWSAVEPPAPREVRIGRMMPYHVAYTITHCIAHYFGKAFFWSYQTGWPSPPLKQALGYITRVSMDKLTARNQRREQKKVLRQDEPFFLVALQKSGDSQIEKHSEYPNVVAFIDHVAADFARNAPADAHLVFKAHPLDYGIEPQGRAVRRAEQKFGLQGRLVFLPTGSLSELTDQAQGMVTVNSTAGLSAITKRLPTIVLGNAFYKVEGIVNGGDLAAFWQNPQPPDETLTKRFRDVAIARTQINGSYYAPRGRRMALPVAARRMLARVPAIKAVKPCSCSKPR